MRININNNDLVELVDELCNDFNCSPTQLIIRLLKQAHAQKGCRAYEKEEADQNNLY